MSTTVEATVMLTAFLRDGEQPTSFKVPVFVGLADWDTRTEEDRLLTISEWIFTATNLQTGKLWERISPLMPADRNHTSLSVGDNVMVGTLIAHCDSFGWTVDRLVEVSRRDALKASIAVEANRKLGIESPEWLQQAANLVSRKVTR